MSSNRAGPSSSKTSPTHSRSSSIRSQNPPHNYAPSNPSGLREAHTLSQSPEDKMKGLIDDSVTSRVLDGSQPMQEPSGTWSGTGANGGLDGTWTDILERDEDEDDGMLANVGPTERTSLLQNPVEYAHECTHGSNCDHGTFSPRPMSRTESTRSYLSGGKLASGVRNIVGSLAEGLHSFRGGADGRPNDPKRLSISARLAQEHGIKTNKKMYITYYVPFFAWVGQYRWSFLQGDLIAAITMASFYIPMALSYASNLGHIPPINGLYSFVFNPLIYAFLGSCPQMVVGPEAAGSLLLGSVVRDSVDKNKTGDDNDEANARVAGVVTGVAGAVILIGGLTRLGFLDSVLSRPFMRGFISSVGFIIIIDQLLTQMGLAHIAALAGGVSHGSSVEKIGFLLSHWRQSHGLTCAVAFISFAIIMVAREIKKRLQPRYPTAAYIPDRFLVVVLSAVLTYHFRWDKEGLEVLGEVKAASGHTFSFNFPFQNMHMKHIREAMGTSFLIALLGFFESSVAAKALGGGEQGADGIQGIQLSPNRELVALGVANIVGGCFMALPAFGGYGRSKVNASTGGKTPMSSIFLSLITVLCVMFLLPYFYYLPKSVLSSMITVVAWTLIEEAPHDIAFFIRIRGFPELSLMFLIFAATIFYSLTLGIAIGVGLSLLSVIKHSTRPRIQILGRLPGTNRFENAEEHPDNLEFVEGCLIVKIPEPLTFANTGDLKNRLRRLELYGATGAHPALPRVRQSSQNKNIVFDIHGVTGLDGSGAQVLKEIVEGYRARGVRVWFSRGPKKGSKIYRLLDRAGIVENCGGEGHFVDDVAEALRLTEIEELGEEAGYENFAGDEGGG